MNVVYKVLKFLAWAWIVFSALGFGGVAFSYNIAWPLIIGIILMLPSIIYLNWRHKVETPIKEEKRIKKEEDRVEKEINKIEKQKVIKYVKKADSSLLVPFLIFFIVGLRFMRMLPIAGFLLIVLGLCFLIPYFKRFGYESKINGYDIGEVSNEVSSFEERERAVYLSKMGKENGWGNLISFYSDFLVSKNSHTLNGEWAIYENGIRVSYSETFFIPKTTIANETNGFGITFKNDLKGNWNIEVIVDHKWFTWNFDQKFLQKYEKVLPRIEKFIDWYYEMMASKQKNVDDYKDFCNKIETLKNDGFEIMSIPLNLGLLDIKKYLCFKDKFYIFGRSNKTSECIFQYNKEYIRCSFSEFLNYSIKGSLDKESHFNMPNTEIKSKFSYSRAAVGYALAGPIGALALGEKKSKLPLATYTYTYTDTRKVNVKLKDKNIAFPYETYDIFKQLYPEKEEVTFIQLQ